MSETSELVGRKAMFILSAKTGARTAGTVKAVEGDYVVIRSAGRMYRRPIAEVTISAPVEYPWP